jgi:CRP-like cAMP-binding protein
VHEGEAPGEVYRLHFGWSARFRVLASGDRQILAFDLPGDFLTPELLCGTPARFSKLALTQVTLCAFPVESTSDELFSEPDKADLIQKLLVRHIRDAEDRIMMLGRMSAASRIAVLLLEIHRRLCRRGLAGEDSFDFPLRHEDIGDALGLTAAHVSRTLATLRHAGLVEIDAGHATIDQKGLAKLTH